MQTTRKTTKSLGQRGTIQGLIISNNQNKDLCTYYGGVRYGLPASERENRPYSDRCGTATVTDCFIQAGAVQSPYLIHIPTAQTRTREIAQLVRAYVPNPDS